MTQPLPRQSTPFDEHRNTSRVFPVPPDALRNAELALAALRRNDPALVSWITEGAPNLTEEEHAVRFGGPYNGVKRRKAAE